MSAPRKRFLLAVFIASMVVGGIFVGYYYLPPMKGPITSEAYRLTRASFNHFWSPHGRIFRAQLTSAESVDSEGVYDHGYTFWPSILMFQALADAEKQVPGRFAPELYSVYWGLDQYYDANKHAYNAWLTYPGNNDKYYDDNGLAIIGLVSAYEATGLQLYLERANEILEQFTKGGWNATDGIGGVRWGTLTETSPSIDRNACSTTLAALGALKLAQHNMNRTDNINWAAMLIAWMNETLVDPIDNLVRDGLAWNAGLGIWEINPMKWTYNTGNLIWANALLYELTEDNQYLSDAERLASAALNRGNALYDQIVSNLDYRYWFDAGFFIHHLVEGLLALYRISNDESLRTEVARNVQFAMQYLKDPGDGLYWRNWRLWTIDSDCLQAWESLTGQSGTLSADASERSQENLGIPVENRPMTKTLLGNAGMCRILWLAGLVLE